MKNLLTVLLLIYVSLSSCVSSGGGHAAETPGDTLTRSTTLLTIVDHGGYQCVDIADPWNEGRALARYVMAPASMPADSLPGDRVRVNVPLERSVVYSTVYAGAIGELGGSGRVKGVAEGRYFKQPAIVKGLADGSVTDIGSSMSPNIETLVALRPDAILVSPYQNAGHGAIATLGVPLIEMADYMEPTPEARAEWIKLLGILYGNAGGASAIFDTTVESYNSLAGRAAKATPRPSVVAEQPVDGVWYVPGGRSYMARLFADAGADYPWRDDTSTGSLQLDATTVFDRAHDADYWLLRTADAADLTMASLAASGPLAPRMKAFAEGRVYASNTSRTSFYEDLPFHPDKVLREFILIFHPSLAAPGEKLIYFKNVE